MPDSLNEWGMKRIVWVGQMPQCDVCTSKDAVFDVPTLCGPWANLCRSCLLTHGGNIEIGTEKVRAL